MRLLHTNHTPTVLAQQYGVWLPRQPQAAPQEARAAASRAKGWAPPNAQTDSAAGDGTARAGRRPHEGAEAHDTQNLTGARQPTVEGAPTILLLDFRAALPSISQRYMRECMKAARLPGGWLRLVELLYGPADSQIGRAALRHGEHYVVTGGSPQGCPLSGSAFALATVPLLLPLRGLLGARAGFAYADDIGLLIEDMGYIPAIARTFDAFRRATELELRLDKCKLIPTRIRSDDFSETKRVYAALVASLVPGWREVNSSRN